MTRSFRHFWIILAVWGVLQGHSQVAQADSPPRSPLIQPVVLNLSANESAPFIEWPATGQPTSTWTAAPELSETTTLGKTSTSGESRQAVSDIATRSEQLNTQRNQWRASLTQSGASLTAERDELTGDVLNVAKWTIASLVLGIALAVGLKRFGVQITGPASSSHFKLIETMSLGRQQGLHLIEVGEERFIVAADQGGIRSVTLLPNWPSMDNSTSETAPNLQIFPEPDSLPRKSPLSHGAA